ncbi:LysR family transcriptional regulator [Piscinibacter sakaiensis]|uniref:LysR family transcriptional regulator n=1 Tax=Piscinibacter sakaiensis TaxID=1547922 RepID=UPI003AACB815
MELRHLRYFAAVAGAGHITRAAEQLGIQQPPLSQQIRALEDELGLALFVRHPKGVELTEAGRQLQVEAARLLGDFDAMRKRMAAFAQGQRGRLAIGFTSSAAAHAFTPEALRLCRSRHPEIELVVSENNAAEITEAVAAQRLHCGFLRVPVATPRGVALEPLLQEATLLALPSDHRLARAPDAETVPVSLAQLRGEKLILVRRPGAPGLYANLLAACERQRVQVEVVAEVERMMTNLNLVAAGVGISVVPASMSGAHRHAIVYRPLAASARLGAPITLVWREADAQGPLATFITLAREVAARYRERRQAASAAAPAAPPAVPRRRRKN